MMKTLLFVTLLIFAALSLTCAQQVLSEWEIALEGGETTIPASLAYDGLAVSALQPDSGLNAATPIDNSAWLFSNWTTRDFPSTLGHQRITWTLTPKPGRSFQLRNFIVDIQRDALGPTLWLLEVNTPSFSWSFGEQAFDVGRTHLNFQTRYRVRRAAPPTRYSYPIVDGPTTFELYGYNATDAAGVGGIANATTPYLYGYHEFLFCPPDSCDGSCDTLRVNLSPGWCGGFDLSCKSSYNNAHYTYITVTQDPVSDNYTVTTYAYQNCTGALPMESFTGPCGDCSDINTMISCNSTCARQFAASAAPPIHVSFMLDMLHAALRMVFGLLQNVQD